MIWVRANLPPGISLEKSAEVAARIRAILAQSPEVKLVTSQTGRQESNTEPFGPNRNEFLVALKPYSTWPPGMTKADLVAGLADKLRAAFPGATFNFTQPIIDMVTESVTGSSADLAVILSGPDLALLRAKADQVLEMLRERSGRRRHRHRAGGRPAPAPHRDQPAGSGALRHQRRATCRT